MSLLPVVLLAAAGLASVQAYPNPLNISGDYHLVHDPSLTKRGDGKYFLYCTGDNGPIRSSDDLVTWKEEGVMWPNGNPPETTEFTQNFTSLWAPDVTWLEDKGIFRDYQSSSTFGSQHSAISLAESPTGMPGDWTSKGLVIQTSNESDWNAIDPALYRDQETGRHWLSVGSFWGGIQLYEVDPESGFILQNATRINISRRPTGSPAQEAPSIVKVGAYFYLFTAWDKCCSGPDSTYNVRVVRASSITGPYYDQSGQLAINGGGNVVLAGHGTIVGPGHQDIFEENGNYMLVYHHYLPDGSSDLALNYLDFSSGWPIVV